MNNPHLISVDELRAAGALDVPASWRNSLFIEPDLFSGFIDEEEVATGDQAPHDEDENELLDDRRRLPATPAQNIA